MELKYLNTFHVIVEVGSFSKAAEKLNYTQSAITFQMGQLEQALSVTLFEKIGRRMMLTKAGEQLIPFVEDILNSVDRLHSFGGDLAQYQGALRIGVAETQLCYRMPPYLKKLHTLAPKAQLFLQSMNCYGIRDGLLDGTLDMGVFYKEVGGFGSMLKAYPIGSCPLTLVASPAVAAQCPDFITPDRTLPISFIINEKNCIFRQMFERHLQKKSIILDHTIELWSIPTIKNLVQNDVGISYLPTFTVQEELDSGALVQIPTDIDDQTITAVCAHHKNKWLSPLMQLFIDLLSGE